MDRRTFLSLALAAPAFGQAAKAVIQGGTREVAWTQWGGPTRNFQTEATRLRDSWPPALCNSIPALLRGPKATA